MLDSEKDRVNRSSYATDASATSSKIPLAVRRAQVPTHSIFPRSSAVEEFAQRLLSQHAGTA
jgi:hypothetical protein